jgi:hypothetical protein
LEINDTPLGNNYKVEVTEEGDLNLNFTKEQE